MVIACSQVLLGNASAQVLTIPPGARTHWVVDQAEEIVRVEARVKWKDPVPIPLAQKRQILVGTKLYI